MSVISATWGFPYPSVALTTTLYFPLFCGIHSSAQRTQELREIGSLRLAVIQVFPPSVLTSTFDIPLSPAKAMPAIGLLLPGVAILAESASNLFRSASPGRTIFERVWYLALFAQPLLCQNPS